MAVVELPVPVRSGPFCDLLASSLIGEAGFLEIARDTIMKIITAAKPNNMGRIGLPPAFPAPLVALAFRSVS